MGFLSHGAPPEMGGEGVADAPATYVVAPPDLGNAEWTLVANVVQLQSYNFICLLQPPASCRRFAFPQPFSATDRNLPSSCPVRADCDHLQTQMTRHFPKSIQAPCRVASTIESRHVCGAD